MQSETTDSHIARSASGIGFATFLSRIFGLARDLIDAHLFGAGLVAEAYKVAYRIPNILRDLLGEGVLSSAFIPVFTEHIAKKDTAEAWKLVSILINIMVIFFLVFLSICIIVAPFIVRIMAPGWYSESPEKFTLTVSLTRIIFPFIAFMSFSALFMGALNCFHNFSVPAFAPVLFNIVMILAGVFICPHLKQPIYGWTIAALAGGFVQMAFQFPALLKKGFCYYPILIFNHPGVKQIALMMLPAILALSVTQINILISTIFVSFLKEGSVNWLYYSQRLMQLPLGVFGVAVATAVFPLISEYIVKEKIQEARNTLSFAIRLSFFINIPAAVGLMCLAEPIIRLLFEHGKFTPADTVPTANALLAFAIALPGFAGVKILVPSFYSLKETKIPVIIAVFCVLLNIILSVILMNMFEHVGLALAMAISTCCNFIWLIFSLRRKLGGINGREIINSLLYICFASLGMAVAVIIFRRLSEPILHGSFILNLILVVCSIFVGVVFYILHAKVLRLSEMQSVMKILKR